jgi:gamma-glutamyltranspeptidase
MRERERARRLALCIFSAGVLSVSSIFSQTALSADQASYRPPITGKDFVVESNNPLASMSGAKILQNGGNAVDAAVAVAASLSVAEPALSNIFGGDAFIMIYSAKEKKITVVNATGWAPTGATPDYFLNKGGFNAPIDTVQVPGAFSGWMQALQRYGTKKPAEVFQPAVELCEKGVTVTPFYNMLISGAAEAMNAEAKAVFTKDGKPLPVGGIVYQPNLAKTFRDIGSTGSPAKAEAKYYKEYGQKIAAFSKSLGGLHTAADFADFKAEFVEPLSTNFNGLDIYACPPGCQGMVLIEALNILEPYDLKAMGQNSPAYINAITEALNLAFADRNKYCGDPRFVKIPIKGLTSKEYAAKLREQIKLGSCNASIEGGAFSPEKFDEKFKGNTTFFSIVDKDRNVVACTTSINGLFGSGLMAGDTGIILNNRMIYFWLDEGHPNVVAPRKRTFMTITPSIAVKDGAPYMTFGTPGSDVQEQTKLQILLNHELFGMNPQQAIEAPRFMTYSFPSADYPHDAQPGVLRPEGRIPEATCKALSDMGYKVKRFTDWSMSLGGAGMIVIDPKTGFLMGGVDPRREGYVLGW